MGCDLDMFSAYFWASASSPAKGECWLGLGLPWTLPSDPLQAGVMGLSTEGGGGEAGYPLFLFSEQVHLVGLVSWAFYVRLSVGRWFRGSENILKTTKLAGV